ncbi:TPA: helix-turn-helix domain-containing protein [Legionella pneumophila]|nr:helix-turn-helix domain-containing protein [Legionella pneumophila]HAT5916142.1 helix-turn-helix domain-containing protein [Legionella pneumophila]HAT7773736.1 helix-turn-helix domain-containing protein [Legionella pneumophila]HAT7825311.1 helix-turn-helix domain-containing protein [Legionella pneumophila]HAT7918648.1 helix-turn-helix domain-containing protein [Legionella pneumophila]
MMNIKEKIGERIFQERQAKGLTRKALAELTDDLKPSRINNWERGIRTPGPEEIKQLAEALEVAPGYLMCLTDDKQVKQEFPWLGALVPLLDAQQACDPKAVIQAIRDETGHHSVSFIPLSPEISQKLGENAFALRVQDDSMVPELKIGDVIIADPDQTVRPGWLVVANLQSSSDTTVRRYKQLTNNGLNPEYELIPTNENWASVRGISSHDHKIIGVILAIIRAL